MIAQFIQESISRGGIYGVLVTIFIASVIVEGLTLPIMIYFHKKEEGASEDEIVDEFFSGPNLNNFRAMKNWFVRKRKNN